MPSVGLGGGLETVINFYGRGRDAIDLIVDEGSFQENLCGGERLDPEWAESALVGTARISGETVTVIANDAGFANPRFRMVYAGLMGLEVFLFPVRMCRSSREVLLHLKCPLPEYWLIGTRRLSAEAVGAQSPC
jgi:hypothetical protein